MSARISIVAIIRDDGPVAHLQSPPNYRTVRFELSEEQAKAIAPRNNYELVERLILDFEERTHDAE